MYNLKRVGVGGGGGTTRKLEQRRRGRQGAELTISASVLYFHDNRWLIPRFSFREGGEVRLGLFKEAAPSLL